MSKIFLGVIVLLMLLCPSACSVKSARFFENQDGELAQIEKNIAEKEDDESLFLQNEEFAIELLKKGFQPDNNILYSPASIIGALSIISDMAEGNTQEQIKSTVSFPTAKSEPTSASSSTHSKLRQANAIWVNDTDVFCPNLVFLNDYATKTGVKIAIEPFSENTATRINTWIAENTGRSVSKVIDDVPEQALVCIVNSLTFEAEWAEPCPDRNIEKSDFTMADGRVTSMDFMRTHASKYLKNETCTGFVKYYKDKEYEFVALLPNKNTTLQSVLDELAGGGFQHLLSNANRELVNVMIPKFSVESAQDLQDILRAMGITDVFDDAQADFSPMGRMEQGNLYINQLIHNTNLVVDKIGTYGGATTVGTVFGSVGAEKDIELSRPFIYAVLDCVSGEIIFIGIYANPMN